MKKEIELYCSKKYVFINNNITEKIKCSERKICAGCQYLVDYSDFLNNVAWCGLDDREQRLFIGEDGKYPYFPYCKDFGVIYYTYKCKYRDISGEGAICTYDEYCDQKEK